MLKNFNSKSSKNYYTPMTGSLSSYLFEISKCKILEETEIRKLIRLAKKGDYNASEKIIKSQLRFVITIAKRYSSGNYELLCDLINEGNIGLIQAIDKFDMKFDNKFITYSKDWIKKKIFEYLTSMNDIVKITNKNKTLKIKSITNKFLLNNCRLPDVTELLDILEYEHGIKILNEADLYQIEYNSINDVIEFDSGHSDMESECEYNNLDKMSNNSYYEDEINEDYFKTIIDSAIGILTPKEKEVITLLYGIDQFKTFEIQEVAETIGLTGEAVRLINKRALTKMKEEIIIQNSKI